MDLFQFHENWKLRDMEGPLAGGDPVQVTRHGGWSPLESPDGAYLY
jgi:hypothetical protein